MPQFHVYCDQKISLSFLYILCNFQSATQKIAKSKSIKRITSKSNHAQKMSTTLQKKNENDTNKFSISSAFFNKPHKQQQNQSIQHYQIQIKSRLKKTSTMQIKIKGKKEPQIHVSTSTEAHLHCRR